ncbi:unnamed protein product, partial [Tuber aestivum]
YDFTPEQIAAAANEALEHLIADRQVATGPQSPNHWDYPHQYKNHEGFIFNSGYRRNYYEFPLLGQVDAGRPRVYTGGEAGPDRVII